MHHVLHALRIKLHSGLRQLHACRRWQIPVAHNRAPICLHAQVVTTARLFQPRRVHLGALLFHMVVFRRGLVVLHRQVKAHRQLRPAPFDRLLRRTMRRQQPIAPPLEVAQKEVRELRGARLLAHTVQRHLHHLCYRLVACHPRHMNPVQHVRQVSLVHRRCVPNHVAKMFGHLLAIARVQPRRLLVLPAALHGKPSWQRDVVVCHHCCQPVLLAYPQHAPVVFQFRARKESFLGLNPRPLH